MAGKMKWNAWIARKGMSQDEAKAETIKGITNGSKQFMEKLIKL